MDKDKILIRSIGLKNGKKHIAKIGNSSYCNKTIEDGVSGTLELKKIKCVSCLKNYTERYENWEADYATEKKSSGFF
jgi:hypothetical protein